MSTPSKLLLRFLHWFCHPDLIEDVEGDLMELYEENVKKKGLIRAKWLIAFDIMRLFRSGIIRSVEGTHRVNYYGLIKHNFLITFRVLRKDRSYSTLNTLGLTLGIAAFIAIFLYVDQHKNFDSFHANHSNLYRINYEFQKDGMAHELVPTTPPRVASYLYETLPEVINYVRVYPYFTSGYGDLTLSNGKKKFREKKVYFVDPSFLQVFSFPLLKGDSISCLKDIRTMVITKSSAVRYFGQEDPMGKSMSYKTINWWYDGEAEDSWGDSYYHSYLLLKQGSNPQQVQTKMRNALKNKMVRIPGSSQIYSLQPIVDVHRSTNLKGEINPTNHVSLSILNVISIGGWLILAIAWINYINLATVRALKRAQEVGIRKTLGAKRFQLFSLFILESLLIHMASGFLAIILLVTCSESLSSLLGFDLTINVLFDRLIVNNYLFYGVIASILIGIYPASILAAFKPMDVLKKGNITSRSGGLFRKSLVVFQITVSIVLMVGSVIIFQQLSYMQKNDMGFEKNNKLVIRGPNMIDTDSDSVFRFSAQRFFNEMQSNSYVTGVTTTNKVPGEEVIDQIFLRNEDEPREMYQPVYLVSVGQDYFSTLNIQLVAGRDFAIRSDMSQSLILNESCAKLLGYHSANAALGQTVLAPSGAEFKIIGIVRDYHQVSSKNKVTPLTFSYYPDNDKYYIINFKDNVQRVIEQSEALMLEMFPRDPFDFFFLDEEYAHQYVSDTNLGKIISLFSGLAIVIACLGLIGLASQSAISRVKEIGIRKTFGASVQSIVLLLTKETSWLVLGANLIAWPIVFVVMNTWLENFAYRISIDPVVFIVSGFTILLLAVGAISLISYSAASSNPMDALRDE